MDITEKDGIVVPQKTDVPPPVDSKLIIETESLYRNATITVTAPQNGGKDFSYEEIIRELEQRSIIFGIDHNLIKQIVSEKRYDYPFPVANFQPPQNGENGAINYKFEKEYKPKPKISEDGKADYKELGLLQIVKTHTVIAEIVHPTPGIPGKDIRNIDIPPVKGEKANFSIGQNITVSEDGLRLVAAKDGVLRWLNDGFSVETTLTVENVDNTTGNLNFLGDILVRGDVREGFSVIAEKSITVHGSVNSATLTAAENITIKAGCLLSKIKAGGEISASFFENSVITAEKGISAQSFVYCRVTCGGSVSAKGVGVIVGGTVVSQGNIYCNVLGSKNYVRTEIIVGNTAVLVKERSELLAMAEILEKEIENLARDIKYLMEKRANVGKLNPEKQMVLDTSMKQRMLKKKSLSENSKRIDQINELLAAKTYREVVCKTAAFPNVEVHIGEGVEVLQSKYTNVVFKLNEKDNTIDIQF